MTAIEKSLSRRLFDVACRIRVGETLFRDDEIVEEAAHILGGHEPEPAAQPQQERDPPMMETLYNAYDAVTRK